MTEPSAEMTAIQAYCRQWCLMAGDPCGDCPLQPWRGGDVDADGRFYREWITDYMVGEEGEEED